LILGCFVGFWDLVRTVFFFWVVRGGLEGNGGLLGLYTYTKLLALNLSVLKWRHCAVRQAGVSC
jgi:hypothetical protein